MPIQRILCGERHACALQRTAFGECSDDTYPRPALPNRSFRGQVFCFAIAVGRNHAGIPKAMRNARGATLSAFRLFEPFLRHGHVPGSSKRLKYLLPGSLLEESCEWICMLAVFCVSCVHRCACGTCEPEHRRSPYLLPTPSAKVKLRAFFPRPLQAEHPPTVRPVCSSQTAPKYCTKRRTGDPATKKTAHHRRC